MKCARTDERRILCRFRRSPCGERGLKLGEADHIAALNTVAPRAGSVD